MKKVIYVHGKGGNAEEAKHYITLFPEADVSGFDYRAETPWEARTEFSEYFATLRAENGKVTLIANSIGAYFAMMSLDGSSVDEAFLVSPVVDMEKLITDMMGWAGVTKEELEEKKEIKTSFGETLFWDYYCYAKENPVIWRVKTHILYGERDGLTSFDTVKRFADGCGSDLTVMNGGEHWFHTDEQMAFLDEWIKEAKNKKDRR